jgi:hypothetical protein
MKLPSYPQENCWLASDDSLLGDEVFIERNQACAAESWAMTLNHVRLDDARYPAYTSRILTNSGKCSLR